MEIIEFQMRETYVSGAEAHANRITHWAGRRM